MASSKPLLVSGDIVRELECIVCMEQKRLQLLSCGHRCCQQCIDEIRDGGNELQCPFCRREIMVPDDGFPICRLSDYLRDQVNIAQNRVHSAKSTSKKDGCSSCFQCQRPVEARCYHCMKFLCYRCTVRTECTDHRAEGKHLPDDLDDLIPLAHTQLENWRAKTHNEIEQLKDAIKQQKRELDDKLSVLKASEVVSTEPDKAEQISLIEQICNVKAVKFHMGKLPTSPSGLKLMACFDTRTQCTTVNHIGKDQLVVGCADGLKVFDKSTGVLEKKLNAPKVQTAVYEDEIFLTSKEKDTLKVRQLRDSRPSELFSFPCNVNKVSQITVNQYHVYVLDRGVNMIVQYHLRQRRVINRFHVPEVKKMSNIKLYPDGSLLVVGSDCKLLRMKVGDRLEQIWRMEFKNPICGLAVISDGSIIVAGHKSKKLFFLNEKGVMWKEIHHDQLPTVFESVSLVGNELVVGGWNSKTLLFFQLH